MTTLYRPVLIESAEQAEALPGGTVATCGEGSMTLTAHRVTSIAVKPDAWNGMDDLLSSIDMVGWTALVPIEAEEEWTPMSNGRAYVNGTRTEASARDAASRWPGAVTGHRYVTPWESAE